MRSKKLSAALASTGVLALLVAAFAASATSAPSPVGSGKGSKTKSICGLGNGKRATGRPIVLGGIFTKSPGIDFSPIGLMADAYFKCVNAQRWHQRPPIRYIFDTEPDQADVSPRSAVKLADRDKVVAIVGNTSDTDCIVNQKFYERRGFRVIGAGVAAPCFTTPNFVDGQHGPALQQHRCGSSARQGRCEVDRRLRVQRPRSQPVLRQRRDHRRQARPGFPRRTTTWTCRSRTRTRSSSRWSSRPAAAAGSTSP